MWENSIKMGGCVDWINLAQDSHKWWAVVNAVMNPMTIKFREFRE
jgi:hypothetical protein